ncbi:hypothetical protein [Streptomyces millisiae]|uniref:PH domain-containing protein n=1 Tax=Streptomyces millisiae TaxID=3075542 RepID=A0ABU2LVH5_9ACTN|nr:hypothetical protein [Streptomyces sp. DSM 44918]MDT0321028.1 hypothetical protein [Streptomyces sp. DSM 44918]
MPLAFLSADRDTAATGQDVVPPHPDPSQWRRPYRLGPWRVGIAAFALLIAAYMLISALIIAVAGTLAGATATVAIAALTILFSLRLLRMGVWVSSRGLRRVGLLTTRTLRWRDVARISTVQQPVRWLGLPRSVQGQAVQIELRQGEPLAPLLTDHSVDFLGRRDLFERAADVLEAWAAENRH